MGHVWHHRHLETAMVQRIAAISVSFVVLAFFLQLILSFVKVITSRFFFFLFLFSSFFLFSFCSLSFCSLFLHKTCRMSSFLIFSFFSPPLFSLSQGSQCGDCMYVCCCSSLCLPFCQLANESDSRGKRPYMLPARNPIATGWQKPFCECASDCCGCCYGCLCPYCAFASAASDYAGFWFGFWELS